jgi:hypothetical protein
MLDGKIKRRTAEIEFLIVGSFCITLLLRWEFGLLVVSA